MVAQIRAFYRGHPLLTLVVIAAAAFLIVSTGLWLFLKPEGFKEKLAFAQIASTLAGGATLVGGLLINLRNLRITQDNLNDNQATALQQLENARTQLDLTQKQLDLTRKGQTTEHFSKAIEQLGDDKTRIRLGGIYALKQIAEQEESSDQRWQIVDILSSYVRERAPYDRKRDSLRRDYDIQVVLYVLKDLTKRFGAFTERDDGLFEHRIDLSFADLFQLDLSSMNLEGVDLTSAHLEGAYLGNSNLKRANLGEAHLENANLEGADLTLADLRGAHLEGAEFIEAKLAGADFGAANLLGANLQKAELEAEVDNEPRMALITPAMLEQANGDNSEDQLTKLPHDEHAPPWWGKLPSRGDALKPGDYVIKLGNIPMSFRVTFEQEWYANTGFLPYSFSISSTGIGTSGAILRFTNVQKVIHSDNPENFVTGFSKKPPDLVEWFSKHPSLQLGDQQEVHPLIGGISGVQFKANVAPEKGKYLDVFHGPCVPIFSLGRGWAMALGEDFQYSIIILKVSGETMTIIAQGSENEFEEFLEMSMELVATINWVTKE